EDGIRDPLVTGVQTCALPISPVYEERDEHPAAVWSAERLGVRQGRHQRLPPPREGGRDQFRADRHQGGGSLPPRDRARRDGRRRSEERRVGKGWEAGLAAEQE